MTGHFCFKTNSREHYLRGTFMRFSPPLTPHFTPKRHPVSRCGSGRVINSGVVKSGGGTRIKRAADTLCHIGVQIKARTHSPLCPQMEPRALMMCVQMLSLCFRSSARLESGAGEAPRCVRACVCVCVSSRLLMVQSRDNTSVLYFRTNSHWGSK